MKVIGGRTMRDLDRETIAAGTAGETLMERAGLGAFHHLLAWIEGLDSRHVVQFLIATGKGNNGGDGHVVARLLAEHTDYPVTVCSSCSLNELKGDALRNAERLPAEVEFEVCDSLPGELLHPGTVIVDALLGTGIEGIVREPYATMIREINESGLPVISLDIPSGVNADDGTVANAAVRADLTVTMGLPKAGLFMGPGAELCGQLRVVDIGIPAEFIERKMSPFDAIFADEVRPFLRRLAKSTHKGSMGRILIVGGSRAYPGAPMLAGLGALRAGGGLVAVAYPASIAALLRSPASALILHGIDDAGSGCHRPDAPELGELAGRQDVLVIGPGLSRQPAAIAAAASLLAGDRPAVLDADGLLAVQAHPELFPRRAVTVLTPHPGEMRRLLEGLGMNSLAEADRLVQAEQAASRLQAIVVLKGANTVIAGPDGTLAVNTSGSPALATGGSGDVLAGIVGAFLAQGSDPVEAAKAAVFVHGLAGELAPRGQRNLIADDLPELLGEAMQILSPFA